MPEALDLETEAFTRLAAGESALEIVCSYPLIQDRQKVFQTLATVPVPGAFKSRRWSNRLLIAFFVLFVIGYSLALRRAVAMNGYVAQPTVGVLGNCWIIYALIKRRSWVYVGIPFWIALMALGGPPALSYMEFMLVLAVSFWLAVRIRRSVFPFLTWRGLLRNADGTIKLPTSMTTPGE